MAISATFLDELRGRIILSALIGNDIKLTKVGHEYKGCCPVHAEKTPSFTVNDAKGFAHCFGCGAHFDAIRWLTDQRGMGFVDAVKELAAWAGMDIPADSPQAAARDARIVGIRPALIACADYFGNQIIAARAAGLYLADRGISLEMIAAFGLGYAPRAKDYCRYLSIAPDTAIAAGLMWQEDGKTGLRFIDRIMVPVHDARGQIISFGGRAMPVGDLAAHKPAKYKNGSATELFDKSRVLFNLHRAAPAARSKPGHGGRIIVVEGYMDVIALTGAGIPECVAPMGTALTAPQLALLWRVHPCPILMFDGDAAGLKAAARACEAALPFVGPGKSLRVALLPYGQDPDDVIRKGDGAAAIEDFCETALPMAEFLFDTVCAATPAIELHPRTPEEISAIWFALETMSGHIVDVETRVQYAGAWRAQFEREVSVASRPALDLALTSYRMTADGGYAFPDTENEAERRLIFVVQNLLKLRESERAALFPIREAKKLVKVMAKDIGFDGPTLDQVCKMIEMEPDIREEKEAMLALYRRVLGIKGPMLDAMLPPALPPGVIRPTATRALKPARPAQALAWLDAGDA